MLPLIKESLSERVNDDVWEIVEVVCRKKVGSGVKLYVKSQKGRYVSVCVFVCAVQGCRKHFKTTPAIGHCQWVHVTVNLIVGQFILLA